MKFVIPLSSISQKTIIFDVILVVLSKDFNSRNEVFKNNFVSILERHKIKTGNK